MLTMKEIEVYYGHVHAPKKISLAVKEGEIVTLIGSNGAGKSTTLNTISGLVRISSGEVRFFDQRMDRLPPHKILTPGDRPNSRGPKNISGYERRRKPPGGDPYHSR